MARVRHEGTEPELIARHLLRILGIRFSVKTKGLPGTPDIVNRSSKWAIFVHGCFWHAHNGCVYATIPKTNRAFWQKKFNKNRERDKNKIKELEKLGYSVLVLWQCELKDSNKSRNKLFKFMLKLDSISRSVIPALHKAENQQSMGKQRPREIYRFAHSKKNVSKIIEVSDQHQYRSRLPVCDASVLDDPSEAFDQSYLRQVDRIDINKTLSPVKVIDLFSGCGGLSLGLEEACAATHRKFICSLALDSDPQNLSVYALNFNPRQALNDDIQSVVDGKQGERLTSNERTLLKGMGATDILLAGPPCQGHSNLNNHTRRTDERNQLYDRVGRFAEIARPNHILIENVPTVVHSRDHALRETISLLMKCGYHVDTDVVDLSNIGVPQKRKRHVLVASLSSSISIQEVMQKCNVSKPRSVKWAIGDLEDSEPKGLFNIPSVYSKENRDRIQYLFSNGLYNLPNFMRPVCHQKEEHSYNSMYGRMTYDEPAQTITSGFVSPGQGRYIHPAKPRTLTAHEAARLQFFPDFFDFSTVKTRGALAAMIGNAVPMKLSYIFGLEFVA